ncbi:DC-STAMP domain-containing protein 1 [Platysternon megacephalum]|uniref:DC-STAMP domain-containing protein 1 n=1 Tax=Platysternon megacephalum TaxID=55544 RepID=A0A4D9DWP0_9SAUR|nr:DC-STAMP domain-containing protein 1 [Platysternon megacephalum]
MSQDPRREPQEAAGSMQGSVTLSQAGMIGEAAFPRRDRDPANPRKPGRKEQPSHPPCLCSEPVCISAPTHPSMPSLPPPPRLSQCFRSTQGPAAWISISPLFTFPA